MEFERIRLLRNERGVTREDLAKNIGVSLSALGNYERGERIPDASLIASIARYFQVTSDYLLGLSDSPRGSIDWPSAVPAVAEPNINSIKRTVEVLLSDTVHSSFGLYTLDCYTEIIELFPAINAFAEKKLRELQKDYPNFRTFGEERKLDFDGVPFLMALATGDEEAIKFAKRLTRTTEEIENYIFNIIKRITDILTPQIMDAIQGKPVENIARHHKLYNRLTDEQRERYEQGLRDARRILYGETIDEPKK